MSSKSTPSPPKGLLAMRGKYTESLIKEVEEKRQQLLQNKHLMDFRDLKAEWRFYRKWRAEETSKPDNVDWAPFYLQELERVLDSYLQGLNLIKQSLYGNVLVTRELKPHIRAAKLLEQAYKAGLNKRYPDPQDETEFYKAIDPMVKEAMGYSELRNMSATAPAPKTPLPSSTTLLSPRIPPPVPMVPKGPPIATGITPPPPQISLLESLYRRISQPKYLGAQNQLLHAKGSGWREKSFAPLFHGIPWHLQETAPRGPGGRGPGGRGPGGRGPGGRGPPGSRGIGGGDSDDDISDDDMTGKKKKHQEPYNINKELHEDPRPARLDFRSFGYDQHPEDYSDEYYKTNYRLLYDRTVEFAEKWFGDVDLPEPGYEGSPWQELLNDQFIEYSRLVAHEDRHVGGWPAFLRQAKYRKWLIVGILGQIMEKKIFVDLLFGADDKWRRELETDDLRLLDVEGYRRKARRSETVKMALRGDFVPPKFFGDVDELTFRTALIFEPLINLLDLYREFNTVHQTNERHFYQELHALLTIAAYFQVCMALSPTPFHILSASPGSRMDWPIERQADIELYRESKEVNEQLNAQWEQVEERLAKRQRVSQADLDRLNALHPFPVLDSPTYEKDKATSKHQRLRGALIKIAVFPMCKRYVPENRGIGPKTRRPVMPGDWDKVEGQRIVEILRCSVIYYQGLIYPRNILEDGVPLETHLTVWRGWERNPVRYSYTVRVAIFLAISLVALFVVFLLHALFFGTPSAKAFIFRFLREIGDFIMLPRRIMKSTLHYNEDSLGLAICRKVCEQWTGACICTKRSTL